MYRIIIADDEPIMRKALLALVDWDEMDCEVVRVCSDGAAALEGILELKPDILISDIKMPVKSGLDLAEYISEHRLPTKVILLTAFADFSFAQQAVRFGVTEYVTKSGSTDELVLALEKCKGQLEGARSSALPGTDGIERFLRSVLDGSHYDTTTLRQEAADCGLTLEEYGVISMTLPVAAQDSKLSGQLEKLLRSVFPDSELHFLTMGREDFCALLCGDTSKTVSRCTELARAFHTLTGQMVYLGLSLPAHTPEALRETFRQADRALDNAFFHPQTAVHRYAEKPPHADGRDLSTLLARFSGALELGAHRECIPLLESLFLGQQEGLTPDEVRREGQLLLNLCRTQLERAGVDADIVEEVVHCREQVLTCRTFSEYCALLQIFLSECCQAVFRTLQYNGNVVLEAKNYIEKNFHRPIALSEIAAALNVNPSYLSRAFKNKTGMNLVDTINRKRVNRARELLAARQMKVYEVAAAVGIEDTTYFSHLFRKYTGVSPRDYQESCARNEESLQC